MDAIFQRRSIRRYEPIPVPPRQMEQLLRAGMAAPTSGNNQEWEFVVIRSAETMARIVAWPCALICAGWLSRRSCSGYRI